MIFTLHVVACALLWNRRISSSICNKALLVFFFAVLLFDLCILGLIPQLHPWFSVTPHAAAAAQTHPEAMPSICL